MSLEHMLRDEEEALSFLLREEFEMNLFAQDDFNQQYQLAKETGDKRFGSPCQHTQTRNGHCLNCLRKVVTCESCGKPSEPTYEVADMQLCGPCIAPQYPD